ncbi:hypothetical protein LS70_009220 [Helicobacter sp. MIT 11-5569]|nr:hypothetical protein LS70_009220 [Helicobacter sp. MIT 11-5569]
MLAMLMLCAEEDEELKSATQKCKVICDKCGFYVSQTGNYFNKLKALNENEGDYYIAMDDWVYYLYKTEEYLRVNGINANFYASSAEKCPTLIFGNYSLEVSKIDSPFIFIIYQKGKKPHVVQNIVMSEDEINAYFNLSNPKIPQK